MIKRYVVVLSLCSVAGCANLVEADRKVEKAAEAATAMRTLAERNATSAAGTRTRAPRIAGEEIVVKSNELPPLFAMPTSYSTKGAQSLAQTLEQIAADIGVQIKASEISQNASGQQGGGSNAPNSPAGAITGNVSFEYSGTVRGLLDEIATRTNAAWRYNAKAKTVEIYRFETRALSIYLPPGSKSIAASISLAGVTTGGGGGASGGGTGPAGNVSVSQNLTVDPWASVMAGIESILSEGQMAGNAAAAGSRGAQPTGRGASPLSVSGQNGSAIGNPELGLVTVTARPAAMERVARYVSSINDRFSQNVLIDVKIFSVSLGKQATLGFNLNMLYNQLDRVGASVLGPAQFQPSSGSPGILTITSRDSDSRWNGSSLVAQALSQFGNVALQTQGQVIAINGQPAPIQVANEITYTASATTSQAANVGVITTTTPGTKVVGFTANFLPLILGDNRILLQYQMQISQLTALKLNPSGSESPEISSQSLQQQAFVKDGQAIVLFGFDQERDSTDSKLSFSSISKAGRSERQMIVIVMQVNGGVKDGQI